MRIGICQFTPVWGNPSKTIEKIERMLPSRIYDDIIVFPEMFLSGFTNKKEYAIDCEHEAFLWLTDFAKKRSMYLCGSVLIREEDRYFNRFYLVGKEGIIGYYDKRHLFSYMGEDKTLSRGGARPSFDLKLHGYTVRIRPAICYDLRFGPWLYNDNNYDILIVVAAWPQQRISAWDTLLKARAIENACITVGVNTWGSGEDGTFYGGQSLIAIFPSGDYLLQPLYGEQYISTTIDIDLLYHLRETYPFLKDADKFTIDID